MWMTISAFVLFVAVFCFETYSRGMGFVACFNRGEKMRKYIHKRMYSDIEGQLERDAFEERMAKSYNVKYSE